MNTKEEEHHQPFASNFIKTIMTEDLREGKVEHIVTRFPPEPNGYLHIGHARAIIINFELADEFGGKTILRFDDTNPAKEDMEYVEAIKEDIQWLGYTWDNLCFASNYFAQMYEYAVFLIKKGKAYVDDLTPDQIRDMRGSLTEPGRNSPYRNRSVDENLILFDQMRKGDFNEGEKVLRAKVDMTSPNLNLRDPVIYRILHAEHPNTGDTWCVYPMYAYAHPLEDAIEGVTHSLCSLEFEDQRPFYDWVIHECETAHTPHQYEFGKLQITNTISGKRHIRKLLEEGVIEDWDDPRVMTIRGMRRRGYTPEAIRAFIRETGVSKSNGVVDSRMLDHFIREDLKLKAARTMAVLHPLKVVITNYPVDQVEWLDVEINAENPEMGTRPIPFSREIYIEQEDFMENPPAKYHRLFPGNEVRLMNAYFIRCEKVIKDADGHTVELHCTYDPKTKSGSGFSGRKVKGTLHWVEASHALPAEFRLFEPLVDPDAHSTSLAIAHGFVEPGMEQVQANDKFQFVRHGYFNVDEGLTAANHLVFNRIVSLKSSF